MILGDGDLIQIKKAQRDPQENNPFNFIKPLFKPPDPFDIFKCVCYLFFIQNEQSHQN